MRFTNSDLATCLSNDLLHLVLMPTEACNFRCVYCYEDFKYKKMEPWVVQGIKRLVTRRAPGLLQLSISWFGGEPTLVPDVIDDVMSHANALGREYPDMRVNADITTNGYLLARPLFQRLVGLGVVHYQISFDGPREWHDQKRVTAGGKGTYDRIWGNLLSMRNVEGEFTIMVRVHADRVNADALPRFIDEYKVAFGQDRRFELFIRGLSRLGGANDANLEVFEPDEGDRVIGALRDYARSQGLRLAEAGPGIPICYASRANSYVVRSNGRLNKCTVALEHPNNLVGRIREDGTLEVRAEKMVQWMRGLTSEVPAELKCPMIGYAEDDGRSLSKVAIPLAPVRAAHPTA